MRKKFILITILLLLLGSGIVTYIFINSKKLVVEVSKNISVNINDKVYNTDYFKIIKNGKLITKKSIINTSKLDKVTVTMKVRDYFKRIKTYSYNINVVDKEVPKITFNDKLMVEEGNDIDLLKDVSAIDNSGEEVKVRVEGDYDLNAPNTYNLEYVAVDSSGNESRVSFVLEVTKKAIIQSPTTGYVAPDRKFTTSNGHSGVVRDGVTYIDGILIANKTYPLPSTYNPDGLASEMWNAFLEMQSVANSQGVALWVKSGFRSYSTQVTLYNSYVARDGKAAADTYSARPGHSEHQSGLAFDLNKIDDNFGNEPEGIWLNNNAWKYGFILRYPKGKTNETGYIYESWHFRYVGKDLASKLYNNGDWITLESYFGITSQYSY